MGRWIDYIELYGDIAITPKVKVRDVKKPKANNNAPKSIKGDYELYIHGNKIELFNQKDGMMVETKCHPDDNFDIGEGIKEAFKKMNEEREKVRKAEEEEEKKIRVGDWVEVVNPENSYPGNVEFFKRNHIENYGLHYRFAVVPEKGIVGKVIYMEKDSNFNKTLYVIQETKSNCYGEKDFNHLTYNNGVYLISDKGLRKVKKPV